MKILFISSVAVITPDAPRSRELFIDTLGLPLQRHADDEYFFSEQVDGSKHFGVWPLSQAAQACFDAAEWPAHLPVPQAAFEFEVADEPSVHSAAEELQAKGYQLLHGVRREPWGPRALGADHRAAADDRRRARWNLLCAVDAHGADLTAIIEG